MGMRPRVTVFYGIDYDDSQQEKFEGDEEGIDKLDPRHPALLYYLGTPAGCGVEVVRYGHQDYRRYGLAVTNTVDRGKDFGAVEITDPIGPVNYARVWRILKDYCAEFGLPWKEPKWWAVPYYG